MIDSVKKILLIDDEERLLNSMAQRLTLMGFDVMRATSGTKAIEIARKNQIDLAIVDLKMPDMDGLMTITKLKEIIPGLRTVLLTGYGNQKIRKKTKNLGSDYFEKDSMSDLWDLIKGFNSHGELVVINPSENLSQSNKDLSNSNRFNALSDQDGLASGRQILRSNEPNGTPYEKLPKIIGETPDMQFLRKDIQRLSGLDCTVIIKGETGTGKELIARTIHGLSHRKKQRFLAFNCGCFSDGFQFNELLHSIEKPAIHSRNKDGIRGGGFFGTILLDHFEVMPEQTQQEMIKIIDSKFKTHTSDDVGYKMDIRFIVATHKDLKERVELGKFNKHLYRKLNAISITVPPLRERRDDIFPLCSYFLSILNTEFKKNIESISEEVFSIFMSYPFPGNVRELKHIIERSVILSDSKIINVLHLPERFSEAPDIYLPVEDEPFLTLNKIEQNHILKAIKFTNGNKSKAADFLGISRAALWRKLKLINSKKDL